MAFWLEIFLNSKMDNGQQSTDDGRAEASRGLLTVDY